MIAIQVNALTVLPDQLGCLSAEVEGVYTETIQGEGDPIVVVTPILNTKQAVLLTAEDVAAVLAQETDEGKIGVLLAMIPAKAPALSLETMTTKWQLQQAAEAMRAGVEQIVALPFHIPLEAAA